MSLVPSYLSALSESSTNPPNTSYEMMIGKRFYRIVKIVGSTHPGFPPRRFVHSFVDMFTGDVFRTYGTVLEDGERKVRGIIAYKQRECPPRPVFDKWWWAKRVKPRRQN